MDHDRARPGTANNPGTIPSRFETLEVMRLMGRFAPLMMLGGDADGYGARWTIHGHEVQPGIARYLMERGYLADAGATELGARRLLLTDAGLSFREDGLAWWTSLGFFAKLKIRIRG